MYEFTYVHMYVCMCVCVWHHLQSDLARLEYELKQLRESSAEQLRNQKRSLTASLEEVWSTRMRWEGKTLWTWSHLVPPCACHCVSQVVDWCNNALHRIHHIHIRWVLRCGVQLISGCLSHCGNEELPWPITFAVLGKVLRSVHLIGPFEFLFFLWWDKQPEIDCIRMLCMYVYHSASHSSLHYKIAAAIFICTPHQVTNTCSKNFVAPS